MNIKAISEAGQVIGKAIGLRPNEVQALTDQATDLSSIIQHVGEEKAQAFIDFVVAELRERQVWGGLRIQIISAAKGNKQTTNSFVPLEYLPRQDCIRVMVQFGGPMNAYFVNINPIDMDVVDVCRCFGLPEPAEAYVEETEASETSSCERCRAFWQKEKVQSTLVELFVFEQTETHCSGDDLNVFLELVAGGTLGHVCKRTIASLLLETTVLMTDEEERYFLGARGKKLALALVKRELSGPPRAVQGEAEKIDRLRALLCAKKERSALEGEASGTSTEFDRSQAELEKARAQVAICEQRAREAEQKLTEIRAKLKDKEGVDHMMSTDPILQLFDDSQVASLLR